MLEINKDNINKIKKILLEKKRIELECAHKDAVLIGLILPNYKKEY